MRSHFQGRRTSLLIIFPPLCSLDTIQQEQQYCQPQGHGTAALHPRTTAAPWLLSGAPCTLGKVQNGQSKITFSQGMHLFKHPSYPSSSTEYLADSPSHKDFHPLIFHHSPNMKADILAVHPDFWSIKRNCKFLVWRSQQHPVLWGNFLLYQKSISRYETFQVYWESHHSFTDRWGRYSCLIYLSCTIAYSWHTNHIPSF